MKLTKIEGDPDMRMFFCPGCQCAHGVTVANENKAAGQRPVWGWNGSMDSPTFTPSVLVNGMNGSVGIRCHSFVKDGMIQFLGDCAHDLKNQTVSLPDWEE